MNTFLKVMTLWFVLIAGAIAAVPAGVDTAISTAGTDSVTVAGAVLAVIVGIFAIKLMRKAL